jgi:hypothetical protein
MMKLVYCLKRRPGMSLEEFQDYWRNRHAPLVKQHADVLGIRRYVQVHTRPGPHSDAIRAARTGGDLSNAPEIYDGVAEIWIERLPEGGNATPNDAARAAAQALLEDEARFIDLANSPLWWAEEHEVIPLR